MSLSDADCATIRQALEGKATNSSYDDVVKWLRHADFVPPKRRVGSHEVWRHPTGKRVQLVYHGHVKRAAQTIVSLGECPE